MGEIYRMCDSDKGYFGWLLKYERERRSLSVNDICEGICSKGIYNKLENGGTSGSTHLIRTLFQRVGINADRCGIYLKLDEFRELSDRQNILEGLHSGDVCAAKKLLEIYEVQYGNNCFSAQFCTYMRARLAQLEGDDESAILLYNRALKATMPDYDNIKVVKCISVYEAFMMLNIAGLEYKRGHIAKAEEIYAILLDYCHSSNAESWNMACIYPKAVCGMLDIIASGRAHRDEYSRMYQHALAALSVLKETSRLHYIRPLLRYMLVLAQDNDKCRLEEYEELLEGCEHFFKMQGHDYELFEWYPYYIDCGFCLVNDLINERRIMHGMTIEELAGTDCSARNLQRIIMKQVSPSCRTSRMLLDKLGLKGALRSDVIVADNIRAYKLWDELVECEIKKDYERKKIVSDNLCKILNKSMQLNCMVIGFEKILAEAAEGGLTYEEIAKRCEELLPFKMSDATKYKILLPIERMIIKKYISCMDRLKRYDNLDVLDTLLSNCADNDLDRKRYARDYESFISCFASCWGNAGEYDKSDELAKTGIRVEAECERMHSLASLLYCMVWNNGQRGNITSQDMTMCKMAYVFEKYKNNTSKMEFLKRWIDNHDYL